MSAGDLISTTPNNGLGTRIVRVWNDTGNPDEKGTNVLLDKTIEENQTKKWCTANNNGENIIEIMFELSDYYDVDKLIVFDCKTQEPEYNNTTDIEIWTCTSATGANTDQGDWQMVYSASGQENVNIKTCEFTPTKARYVKFTSKNVPLIRIYGMEIYGTKSEESVHPENLISVGKPVLKYYDAVSLTESPLSLFDGNKTNFESKWCFARALPTDSLKYVVFDLENNYQLEEVKLYDCEHLESGNNILGYNLYISETMPDLDLITNLEDKNTCWTKIVDAYKTDRSSENIKTDNFVSTPVYGRYVKLEIPYSVTTATVRLFEFEIYGKLKDITTSINKSTPEDQNWFVYPGIVTSGQNIEVKENGTVYIYSQQGAIIESAIECNGETSISTSRMAPGCYIIKLLSTSGNKVQKLIVK